MLRKLFASLAIFIFVIVPHISRSNVNGKTSELIYSEQETTFNMCFSSSTEELTGTLYDSGGPNSNYGNNQSCSFTISPTCADTIYLNVVFFNTFNSSDRLRIFDGTNSWGDMLFFGSGSVAPTSLIATSGSVYISWVSNSSITAEGFQIDWSTTLFDYAPVENPILDVEYVNGGASAEVIFTNLTEGNFIYTRWIFGDGSAANGLSVSHTYESNGIYGVIILIHTCGHISILTETVTITGAPELSIPDPNIEVDLTCSQDIEVELELSNLAPGILNWGLEGTGGRYNNPDILVLTGTAMNSEYYENLTSSIDSYFYQHSLEHSNSTLESTIVPMIEEAEVIVVHTPNLVDDSFYDSYNEQLLQFANDGGTLVLIAPTILQLVHLNVFQLSPSYPPSAQLPLTVVDLSNPLVEGVASDFLSPEDTRLYSILNPNYHSLLKASVELGALSAAGYMNYGQGVIYLIGSPFASSESNTSRLLGNMIASQQNQELPSWIQQASSSGTLAGGSSGVIQFTISSDDLIVGQYQDTITVVSNGGSVPIVEIPISINVMGEGQLAIQESCIDLGEIQQMEGVSVGTWIYNTGCDTAWINSSEFSLGNFNVNVESMIPPFDSTWMSIAGYATELGNLDASLTLSTNSEDFIICIQGNVIVSSELVYSADSLWVSINTCSEQPALSFIASNNSNESLQIYATSQGIFDNHINYGFYGYAMDDLAESQNFIFTSVEGLTTEFSISSTNTTNIAEMQSYAEGKDIIYLPESTIISETYYSNLSNVLTDFVEQGGRLLLANINQISYLNLLNFFNVESAFQLSTNSPLLINQDSPFAQGVSGFIGSTLNSWCLELEDSGINPIVTYNGKPVVFSKNIGMGQVIYFGIDTSTLTPEIEQLIMNCVSTPNYLVNNNLSIEPNEVTLNPGQQQVFTVNLNSSFPGNFDYTLPVTLNSFGVQNDIQWVNISANVNTGLCAEFNYSSSCANLIYFNNMTLGVADQMYWDFGDGVQSQESQPTHEYEMPGDYSVTLTACLGESCSSKTEVIQVSSIETIPSPECTVLVNQPFHSYGIRYFEFGQIMNTTSGSSEGCVDFTCDHMTEVISGDIVDFQVDCYSSGRIKIWIDFDRDGSFNNDNELCYSNTNFQSFFNGSVQIPTNALENVPLRLRLMYDEWIFTDACSNLHRGQYEDYSVIIVSPVEAPIAEFSASSVSIDIGEVVNFTNWTVNGATSYQWIFESANVTTSSELNPSNIYYTPGQYDVTLIASNAFGTDSITKQNYITVSDNVLMCNNVYVTSVPSGTLYDSGGPNGNFSQFEHCSFLIQPYCAETITLSLDYFISYISLDLKIYDGTNTEGTLLLNANGSPTLSSVTATSGAMYIEFVSGDDLGWGFNLSWSTEFYTNDSPVAEFLVSNNNPALGEYIQMIDSSESAEGWLWDFGDGTTSQTQNPFHSYDAPGEYLIQLIAFGCMNSDTTSMLVHVQQPPQISLETDTINISVGCDSSPQEYLTILNNGEGELNWIIDFAQEEEEIKVLLMTGNVNEIRLGNILNAIEENTTNVSLSYHTYSNLSEIVLQLSEYDVVIVPYISNLSYNYDLTPGFTEYLNSGGSIVFCNPNAPWHLGSFFNFSSLAMDNTNNGIMQVNTNNPIAAVLPEDIVAANTIWYSDILNTDAEVLLSYQDKDVVVYRNIGQGRAYFFGAGFFTSNDEINQLFGRVIMERNGQNNSEVNWNEILDSSGAIAPNEQVNIPFEVNSNLIPTGVYQTELTVYSNDPANPVTYVPINLYVNSSPCTSFEYNITCEGLVTLQNTTLNATAVTWDVQGIGSFSENLLELYLPNSGTYHISLQACNEITCVTRYDTISVNLNSPLSPLSCSPTAPTVCCNAQVLSFENLSGLNNQNIDIYAGEFYNDLSCSENIICQKNVLTSFAFELSEIAHYSVYLDFNNSSSFEEDELLFGGNGIDASHQFQIPQSAVTGLPIRLRLLVGDFPAIDACSAIDGGVIYDFAVVILDNELLPNVSFLSMEGDCGAQKSFINTSVNATNYLWDFGDGTNSIQVNPNHIYPDNGEYTVVLTATNDVGVASFESSVFVELFEDNILITGSPVPGNPITFSLLYSYDSYLWTFADGQASTEQYPSFIFNQSGPQLVTVTVVKHGCEHTFTRTLNIGIVGIDENIMLDSIIIYPNPTNNISFLEISLTSGDLPTVELLDITGKFIVSCRLISSDKSKLKYLIQPDASGVYLIRVKSGSTNRIFRLISKN